MDYRAVNIVRDYIIAHMEDTTESFTTYIVWKSKILQNWKYLIASSLRDGMYYELTYNGDMDEWYLDAYKKIDNIAIDG